MTMLLSSCGALNTARPLDQGEHRLGITGGGAVLKALGPPIPLPNIVVEGQTGLSPLKERPLDINYGINTTAIAFGTLGLHLGASHLLLEQKGSRPAISIMDRIHVYNNWLDTTKDVEMRQGFLLNQIDLTASWTLNRHLGYIGIANYLDIADPEFTIAPFAGFQWNSKNSLFLQAETRYLAANRQPEIVDVPFATFGYGAVSVTGSIGWVFGPKGE
jgi:hypothetical protein